MSGSWAKGKEEALKEFVEASENRGRSYPGPQWRSDGHWQLGSFPIFKILRGDGRRSWGEVRCGGRDFSTGA
jgi:hypothetical protein